MTTFTTIDDLEHRAHTHGADIENDLTNNVAYLRLGPWLYVAPLTPVAAS